MNKEIINKLIQSNKTISMMESCTGGALVNNLTNILGSSNVLKYSAITYSTEFKIKMGVDKSIIDKYTVYSIETAKEMSRVISFYTNSNIGIGITGKLDEITNIVYYSIYIKDTNNYYTDIIIISNMKRENAKEEIVKDILTKLNTLI